MKQLLTISGQLVGRLRNQQNVYAQVRDPAGHRRHLIPRRKIDLHRTGQILMTTTSVYSLLNANGALLQLLTKTCGLN